MLLVVASVALLAALLSGAAGVGGNLGATALWLVALFKLFRKNAPVFTSPETGGEAGGGSRAAGWFALAVVVAAFVLRWPIASHDVEHYAGPDEGEVVENVLEMLRMGDFDHRHPGYPGLHFYLQMLPAAAHLAATGKTIPELARSGFYLGARRLTLIAGVLAAVVVFWIGCRWLSSSSAALATTLVALSPLAFRESAVVNPDLMLMLFVAVSLGLSLRLLEFRTSLSFAIAGVSVGLASAVKYTGVFTLAPFVLAWLFGSSPRRDTSKWIVGLVISGIAFVVTSPYTLLNVSQFVRGVSMHVGYYQAAELNASFELTHQLATRGVGVVAAIAAVLAAVRALSAVDKRLLVLLSYPLTYWFVFSFFDRAFPRHALVLLPVVALLAADTFERVTRRAPPTSRLIARVALGLVFVASPVLGSIDLWCRAHRETPAEAARSWAMSNFPPGSRVLQDQHTPRLDSERYDVRRIRVEEKQFVGNYDWVLYSGYPPGLRIEGLREVARFENENALGDLIIAYQVPDRESFMPKTFSKNRRSAVIGAGELPFFGRGWYPPSAGAFETSRLSQGESSEIFFVLDEPIDLKAKLVLGAAANEGVVTLTLNDQELTEVTYKEERETRSVAIAAESLKVGLNRLTLSYDATQRLNRRHQDTAIRLYRLELSKE
ncbi:MAG: hypothetical protein BMS9Abin37_2265 [Acidobacteriota bacterium]|nr:MAG: hypothetical protein BMS9Abin37_2265 [Acidobacteriota bacterium]